jgi:hypothetical protein
MLVLGIGIGMVGAFVVMTIAACAGASLIVRVDQRRQDMEPIPQLGPSVINGLEIDVTTEVAAKALRGIERGLADCDRYKQALESISTVNQDKTAQRIARQALGKGWTA